MALDCIFCSIIARQLPSTVITENEHVIVIKDIAPKAPIHYLILPKNHLRDIRDAQPCDGITLAAVLFMAQELSSKLDAPGAFRLIFNNGHEVGQRVFHLHAHFLAGKQYTDI